MITDQIVSTVRVFVDSQNMYGNPVGIISDENQRLNPQQRQKIAKQLNYSETVFIDNGHAGEVTIFNPNEPVSFAGHALLGTAWFLHQQTRYSPSHLLCSNKKVLIFYERFYWIRGPLSITPNWQHVQLEDAKAIENIDKKAIQSYHHTFVWAWLHKDQKMVRARTFAPDWGIPEDEANGSGSMQLANQLQSELTIIHGKGSVIHAKPFDDEYVDVGGQCAGL